MLLLRRARVPAALLPASLAPAPDPLEPSVLCSILIDGGTLAGVTPGDGPVIPAGETEVDLAGALVFPGFVDAHVHLDKVHTWFRAPNRSGTFAEALTALSADRENWSAEDILLRADFALRRAWRHGTRIVRTHVDTGLPWGETSHGALAELRSRWRGRIEVQTVPLCRGSDYAGREGEALADLALLHGASALGGFLVMEPELPRQLDRLLAIRASGRGARPARRRERQPAGGSDAGRRGSRAAKPVFTSGGLRPRLQPGRAGSRTPAGDDRAHQGGRAGSRSLPLCNLYLQDRRGDGFPRTPFWRGLTLVRDLLDAGVPVACASDNVRDAFYAYGDLDAAEIYVQSVRLAHLDGRLAESVRVVTCTAADLVGRPRHGRIAPGSPAHLVVFEARSFSELLSWPGAPRRCVDGERAIRRPRPTTRSWRAAPASFLLEQADEHPISRTMSIRL